MVRVAGAIVNARLAVKVCAEEPESVTLKLSGVAVPGAVGGPPISPVEAFSAKPAGNVPAVNCHVKAPVPPVAARLCEYATPTWPLGKEAVVIIRVAGVIVNVRLTLAVCVGVLDSVTLNVNGVAATATPLTFNVTDSSTPTQTASVNLTLTITPATLIITDRKSV